MRLRYDSAACVHVFILVFESLVEFGEAHVSTELLEQDLHKDPTGRRRGLLTHPDTLQHLVKRRQHDASKRERHEIKQLPDGCAPSYPSYNNVVVGTKLRTAFGSITDS